jgi:hypothetical protein
MSRRYTDRRCAGKSKANAAYARGAALRLTASNHSEFTAFPRCAATLVSWTQMDIGLAHHHKVV